VQLDLRLQAKDLANAATVGLAGADLIQTRLKLPDGLTLGQGSAARITLKVPAARLIQPSLMERMDEQEAPGMAEAAAKTRTVEKWFVLYPLAYHGIPLAKASDLLVIAAGDGRLLYLRKRNLPRTVDATEATVARDVAVSLARQHAASTLPDTSFEVSSASLEIWLNPNLDGHLAWTFSLTSGTLTDRKARRYWVAAVGQPQILDWENTVYTFSDDDLDRVTRPPAWLRSTSSRNSLTHFGTVTGTFWQTSPSGSIANLPLANLEVTRSTGGTTVTGVDGRYSFPAGAGPAQIVATLRGPSSVIQNAAGSVMQITGSGTPAAAIDLHFGASGDLETAEVTAFYWTTASHTFASSILSPTDLDHLTTRVNINSSCNAYWDGSSINFFKAGGSCPNMAYADVVAHEYGHGVDAMKGGILDGGYSEGYGDASAELITRQPCVGRDFFGVGTCLRSGTDVDLWPPSPAEEVHAIGKRYAQFTWQLIQRLRSTYAEEGAYAIASQLILGAAAGNPIDIPDAVRLSFLADDDDGNLDNGTPHCAELAAAADSRNIPHPACPTKRLAYVWANNPTASSYTPIPTYSYNSSGGSVLITRSGPGVYAVRFMGLGGNGKAGGQVQVTAYGSGKENCKIRNWSSGGADFVVNIQCFALHGAPVNTRYTVLVIWP